MADVTQFKDALKAHLRKRESAFNEHHSMVGSTEGGFFSSDDFDMDALLREIDEFAATFKPK